MTKHDYIEMAVIGAGVLAVAAFVYYSGPTAGSTLSGDASVDGLPQPNAAPNYLTYNQNNPNSEPLADVPTIGGTPGGGANGYPTCSCGGTSNATTFTDSSAFEQSLENSLSGIVNSYQDNILSQFPEYVTQFFNNTVSDTPANTQFAGKLGQS